MKLTTNLVEKVGADKLLHFLFEAWIVAIAMVTNNLNVGLIVLVLISVLSIVKEKFLDETADKYDSAASILGGVVSFVICAIISWF